MAGVGRRDGCGFVPNIMALMNDDGNAGCMLLKGFPAAGILKLIAQPEMGNMYGEILGPEVETKKHSCRRMTSPFSVVSEFQMQKWVIDLLTPTVWLNLHCAQRSLLSSCAGDTRIFLDTIGFTIGLLVEVSEPYMLHLPNAGPSSWILFHWPMLNGFALLHQHGLSRLSVDSLALHGLMWTKLHWTAMLMSKGSMLQPRMWQTYYPPSHLM